MCADQCSTVSGLPELRLLWCEESGGALRMSVIYDRGAVPCPACGSTLTREHDIKAQQKRDYNVGQRRVFIVLMKRRFRCWRCGKVFTEPDEIFGARRRTSQRFRELLGRRARQQATKRVAREAGVSENLVRHCLEQTNEH